MEKGPFKQDPIFFAPKETERKRRQFEFTGCFARERGEVRADDEIEAAPRRQDMSSLPRVEL